MHAPARCRGGRASISATDDGTKKNSVSRINTRSTRVTFMYSSTVVMPRPADLSNAAAKAKPKVLLVDDHPEVVRSLARMLSFDFDVVAEATDGEQALEASSRFDPDIIVLDITMPGLNGFQTARELERRGLRARPMFLTMHDTREFVVEGFRSGGWGYVVKTRVHEDLVRAMRRVLAGQLFVPSLDSLATMADDRCRHAVQFYSD